MAAMHCLVFVLVACLVAGAAAAAASDAPPQNTRYVHPLSFAEARVQVRVEQAELCYPPALLALVTDTIASLTPNATVPDERLALFAAYFAAKVKALVPVCDAYALTITSLGRTWATATQFFALVDPAPLPPVSEYTAYCRLRLQDTDPALTTPTALAHSDTFLRCLRAGTFIELATGGLAFPTRERQLV
jgi:hypothetical protein